MATVIATAMMTDTNHLSNSEPALNLILPQPVPDATASIRLNIGCLSIPFNTQKVLLMGRAVNGLRPPVA
jgi:hypothetical protein